MTLQILSHLRLSGAVPVVSALALLGCCPGLASARTAPFGDRVEVHLHLPASPARNEAMARRSVALIDKAALLACGGSDDSFAQVKDAVRQSACWHHAMTDAIEQTHDERLSAWWGARHS